MNKLILRTGFIIFLFFSFSISFIRYKQFPLDGDMAPIILPSPAYSAVMQDPFGINVLVNDSMYSATNRFFTHCFFSGYFKNFPLLLQTWVSPIDSVYIACAIAKLTIQVFLIFFIAVYISGKRNILSYQTLMAAVIISPLFMVYGYYMEMAIIDRSITYTFFYAFAMCFLLILFYPIYNNYMKYSDKQSARWLWLYIPVIIVSAFSGALNSPVIVLICSSILFSYLQQNYVRSSDINLFKKIYSTFKIINGRLLIVLSLALGFGVYSFYIGKNNIENLWEQPPLTELYSKLYTGIKKHYTLHLGSPLLLLVTIINFIVIARTKTATENSKMIFLFKWFILLSVIYILLLPFGGYRPYRPLIIRYDTIMPVNIGMILFYGLSVYHLLNSIKVRKWCYAYLLIVTGISCIYLNADGWFEIKNYNSCEKTALKKIADATTSTVHLSPDCTIMEWNVITESHKSRYITDLLLHWNIIQEKKLFYQK